MQSSYDDNEPRNVLNNSAHYYAYDHTGNRILKANMFFGNVGVNSNQTLSVPMEAPTVYVNPYYITSHFEEVVLSSKHCYMGSQRIASNMISADFDHEAPLLEPIQAPEGRYGYTNAEAAIVDDILSTLRCLTGDEELAFDLGDFLYLPSIGEGITFTDDEGVDLAAEELPAWLACSQSLYWAQQGGVNCSGLELLYFYHSDYLGSVEFVTDMRGEAYQFFLNTPWGENVENQFARNYTAFSSRFRFNGKEWDEETGNFYYGARYYDPKISVWLSVDPLASKYPHVTPYNFVENNPIMLVDPTGMGPEVPNNPGDETENTMVYGFVNSDNSTEVVYRSVSTTTEQDGNGNEVSERTITVASNTVAEDGSITKGTVDTYNQTGSINEEGDMVYSKPCLVSSREQAASEFKELNSWSKYMSEYNKINDLPYNNYQKALGTAVTELALIGGSLPFGGAFGTRVVEETVRLGGAGAVAYSIYSAKSPMIYGANITFNGRKMNNFRMPPKVRKQNQTAYKVISLLRSML